MSKKQNGTPKLYLPGGHIIEWDGVNMHPCALYGHRGDGLWAYVAVDGSLMTPDCCYHFVGDDLNPAWEIGPPLVTATGRPRKAARDGD